MTVKDPVFKEIYCFLANVFATNSQLKTAVKNFASVQTGGFSEEEQGGSTSAEKRMVPEEVAELVGEMSDILKKMYGKDAVILPTLMKQ